MVLVLFAGYRGQKGERGQMGLGLPGAPGPTGPPGKIPSWVTCSQGSPDKRYYYISVVIVGLT